MRFSPFFFLLCVGVLGCGIVTEYKAVTERNKGLAFIEEEDWITAIADSGVYWEPAVRTWNDQPSRPVMMTI